MCDLDGCGKAPLLPLPEVTDRQRRDFLKGAIALPLAAVLAYPELARAAGEATAPVAIPTDLAGDAVGALALPAKTPAGAVVLIHEWWGLNDQIRSMAAELAKEGYIALAIDLYGGQAAKSPEEAKALMAAVDPLKATEQLVAAVEWLRKRPDGNGKVGTIGWCFGGGWSLNCSLATPVDATVVYYGSVRKDAGQLKSLNSPLLGHFATLDKTIDKAMVDGFEAALKAAGKSDYAIEWYEADHAFANPTGARYDAADAALAWQRTLAFFKQHLA
jgi:carboxymethylenebutenolidase